MSAAIFMHCHNHHRDMPKMPSSAPCHAGNTLNRAAHVNRWRSATDPEKGADSLRPAANAGCWNFESHL